MKIQDFCKSIGESGCLAFCYLYCAGVVDPFEQLKIIKKAMDNKIIDEDCAVLDADKLITLTGKKSKVTKERCESLSSIKEPTPVNFVYGGKNHWVVINNGIVIYNSMKKSNCVNYGVPVQKRVMNFIQE